MLRIGFGHVLGDEGSGHVLGDEGSGHVLGDEESQSSSAQRRRRRRGSTSGVAPVSRSTTRASRQHGWLVTRRRTSRWS